MSLLLYPIRAESGAPAQTQPREQQQQDERETKTTFNNCFELFASFRFLFPLFYAIFALSLLAISRHF